MKKVLVFFMAVFMIVSVSAFTISALEEVNVSVRIEGISKNLYYGEVTLLAEDKLTVKDVMQYLKDANLADIKGLENSYITEVNGEKAGTFGGWDGWMFLVNGKMPESGIGDCKVNNGDSVVLYYAGYPCQIPEIDMSYIQNRVIIVYSMDSIYDEVKGESYIQRNPVADADLMIGESKFTTDSEGKIKLDDDFKSSEYPVQISKKDQSSAPAVMRFVPDFKLTVSLPEEKTEPKTEPTTQVDKENTTSGTENKEPTEAAATEATVSKDNKNPATSDSSLAIVSVISVMAAAVLLKKKK